MVLVSKVWLSPANARVMHFVSVERRKLSLAASQMSLRTRWLIVIP